MALSFFSSGRTWTKAMREASSRQTWTNSQPAPRLLGGTLAGDAVADLLEAADLLDVDVDQLAGAGALVAADRHGRRQVLEPAEPAPAQHAADRGRRDADLPGDLVAGPALATPRDDLRDDVVGRRPTQPMGPRGAIEEPPRALGLEALAPLVHGLHLDPEVRGHGLARLAQDQHAADEFGSTMRRQSGILVDVHSVSLGR